MDYSKVKKFYETFFGRFDCFPGREVNQTKCEARGCCWRPTSSPTFDPNVDNLNINIPFCYYSSDYQSHQWVNSSKQKFGETIFYKRIRDSGYPLDIDLVRVEVTFEEKHRLRIKVHFLKRFLTIQIQILKF